MSKEKKRKMTNEKDQEGLVYFEIWGILLILLSFVLLSELGPVGNSLNTLVKILFGDYYWLTLIFIIYYGVMMVVRHEFITYSSLKVKGIIFLSLGILMFSHFPILNYLQPGMNDRGSNLVILTYDLYMSYIDTGNVNATFGGGIVGASVLTVTLMLVGLIGSKIIASVLLASGIAFLFEKTIYDFFRDIVIGVHNVTLKLRDFFQHIYGRMNEVSKEEKVKKEYLPRDQIEVEEKEKIKPFIHVKSDTISYEKKSYKMPSKKQLIDFDNQKVLERQKEITLENAKLINEFLKEYVLTSEISEIYIGPSISTYILLIKSMSQKKTLMKQIKRLYSIIGTDKIRYYEEYHNEQLFKIEIPNEFSYLISLKEVVDENYRDGLILGRDYKGDFYQLPFHHTFNLLTIGNDISSKIDFLKTIVLEIIYQYTPDDIKLVLFDSTKFELNEFDQLPHLFTPFVDDVKQAKQAFIKLYTELEYRLNGHSKQNQPIIVVINDITDFYIDDYRRYVNYILMYGSKVNIFIICSTINLDDQILDMNFRSMFENILAFQIKNKDLSEKFVDIETDKLLKSGDCIISSKNDRNFTRLQLVTLQDTDLQY